MQTWVNKNAPKLVSFGEGLAKPALSLGKGALALLLQLFTIFILVLLLLLEGPKMRTGLLGSMDPERAERYRRVAHEVNRSVTGYMLGNVLTSVIAGAVVFVTLLVTGVPFPFLWALWVALVDFLPMIGGALAGIPTVLFAAAHSLSAGIITLVVFLVYTQIENHVLNPIVMSRTVRVNPLLVLLSILVGGEIGSWIGGIFGAFVGALLAIPAAGALQVVFREVWQSTDPMAAAAGAAGEAINATADAADQAASDDAGPDGAGTDGADGKDGGAGSDGTDGDGDGAGTDGDGAHQDGVDGGGRPPSPPRPSRWATPSPATDHLLGPSPATDQPGPSSPPDQPRMSPRLAAACRSRPGVTHCHAPTLTEASDREGLVRPGLGGRLARRAGVLRRRRRGRWTEGRA